MSRSMSFGNQVHRFDLVVSGARTHASELPKEAGRHATSLEASAVRVRTIGAAQEKAKQDLALLTAQLKQELTDSNRVSAQIMRLAEATFGPRNPRIREFRPSTEGKATKRAPKAAAPVAPASMPATK